MSGPRIWFTSDLHFGHRKVAELRGFESTDAHDETIAANWHEVVRPKDQVWVLGDIAVSSPQRALAILSTLPGEKHLIWGNHDQGHPMHRDAHRKAGQYLHVFESVAMAARRRIAGQSVLVSHFPYVGDTDGRDEDRHGEWRLRVEGQPMDEVAPIIHGHTHSARKFSWAHPDVIIEDFGGQDTFDLGPQVHVGLDAWDMQLVSVEQIEDVLL